LPCLGRFRKPFSLLPVEGGGDVDKESRKVSSLWLWGDYLQEYWVNNWTKPTRPIKTLKAIEEILNRVFNGFM